MLSRDFTTNTQSLSKKSDCTSLNKCYEYLLSNNTKLRKLFLITLGLGVFVSLFTNCKVNHSHQKYQMSSRKQDSLAFELCQIYGSDQGIRDMKLLTSKSRVLAFIPSLDSINFFKIMNFVETNGFPNRKLLGDSNYSHECVESAPIAVLLHTPHMLVNNKQYLNVFIEEVKKGNIKPQTLALILDKYYWVKKDEFGNRELLYGSQFGKPCFKNRKKSDSVRNDIGLPPLPDSMFIDCKKQ